MKLVIDVNTLSNEDGKYEEYDEEYVVENFQVREWSQEALQAEVDRLSKLANLKVDSEFDDGFFYQDVTSWSIEEDDFVTRREANDNKFEVEFPEYEDDFRWWSPVIVQATGEIIRKARSKGKIYINNVLQETE